MRVYETTYILNPSLEEEQVTQLQDKYSNMVVDAGGEIINIDKWGKRKLAYEVADQREGIYIIMKFNADKEIAINMKKNMNISDDVIKSMFVVLN